MDSETRPTSWTYTEFPEVPNFSTLFQSIDHMESGRAKANGVVDRKRGAGESSQRKRTWNNDGNKIISERSEEFLQSERVRKLLHSGSERRRRERIKRKITTLKELIPDCNKTGDAEIIEAAAKYIKWMQLHIQRVSIMRYVTSRNQMEGYQGVPSGQSQATVSMQFPGTYEALTLIQQPMQYFNPFQQHGLGL